MNKILHLSNTGNAFQMKTRLDAISRFACVALLLATSLSATALFAHEIDIPDQAKIIASVGLDGIGHSAASRAVGELSKCDKVQLPEMLRGLDGVALLSANWMRAAIETVAEKPGDLPVEALKSFLAEQEHSPWGRRLAFELLVNAEPGIAEQLLPEMMEDTSLENRYDAIQWFLDQLHLEKDREGAIAGYRKALDSARSIKQIESIIKLLDAAEVKVDITKRLGFITQWKLIGPFDNANEEGFDVVYAPEKKVDLQAKSGGKLGEVEWISAETDTEFGVVDLTEKLGKHKGAIAYAYHEFVSDREQVVEIRLGCINANKVWVNGSLVMSNEVYHSGTRVDQYVARAELKQGTNPISLKICQNEQEQPWAQKWEFNLRVCDATGKPIYSQPVHSQQPNDDNI